jgi:hypothetical protein
MQHTDQHIEQRARDLGGVIAQPHGGQSQDADEIVDTTLEALDILSGSLGLYFHVRGQNEVIRPVSLVVRGGLRGTRPAERRMDFAEQCPR